MQRVPPAARLAQWHAWVAWIALAIALFTALWMWPRLGGLESEATRRLQGADQRVTELEAALKYAQDQLRDTQNRTAVLEGRVLETAGLQAQVEKLYRSLASDSTDMLLVEIESALALANQQLVLGTHPQVVLGALQEIDLRLGRQDDPSLAGVRRALLGDIDRLKAFPAADVGALALRLDSLLGTIDMFPLAASVRAPAPRPASQRGANGEARGRAARPAGGSGAAESPAGAADPASRATDAASRATDAAAAGLSALRDELQQLFRVRRIDTPDAVLVAPEQAYFLRQNLRLLLLNARLALLSRNEALFHNDLERATHWLRAYYDGEHRGVAGASAQLRQMMGARIALEAPTLAESLAATRAARAAREARR
ncbi:MAG: uroporphyrinogen-III C-methyltransferase [Burkholderiaceae bacterium]|nr:uroporphyrinogen-III C-methyltransferase [Burkholderiaceae bacterium]